jgi:hypothetical protein
MYSLSSPFFSSLCPRCPRRHLCWIHDAPTAIASSSQLCFYSSSPLHLPVSSPGNLCRCPHQIICSISPLRQATGPPPSPLGSAPSTMRPSLRLEAGGPSTPLTVSWGCSTPRTGTAARPPSRSCCRAAPSAHYRSSATGPGTSTAPPSTLAAGPPAPGFLFI